MSIWRAVILFLLFATSAVAQEPFTSFRDCDECPELIVLPGGAYLMGSPADEIGHHESEAPQHEVSIPAPFAITTTEITVSAFAAFVEATGDETETPCWAFSEDAGWTWNEVASWRDPLFPQTEDHPVTCVSRQDAAAYAQWLSLETGQIYRLPSEAEWEYAARGNTQGPRYWEGPREAVCGYANTNDISGKNHIWKVAEPCDDGWLYAARVGFFVPNPFGLFDMQGNVWEWTQDCFAGDYFHTPHDGSAYLSEPCERYILRGGSWTETPGPIRIAIREWRAPEERFAWAGFRLVRQIE